jgi:hypothetical protein
MHIGKKGRVVAHSLKDARPTMRPDDDDALVEVETGHAGQHARNPSLRIGRAGAASNLAIQSPQ